jgi:hypothetical protein
MFGLDEQIAALSAGQVFAVIAALAALLGLRHATDPDHLTAVSTLIAGEGESDSRRAGRLGLAWGLGHATTLFLFGLPIVLFDSYLPDVVQSGAEVVIGIVIMALALRLLLRWRRGGLHVHRHDVGRTPLQGFGIGLVHGVGGSAGVGVLLLAAIPDQVEGAVALAVFALFTAISMALASTTLGYALSREAVVHRFASAAPALAVLSLAFGAWYSLGAAGAVPYVF